MTHFLLIALLVSTVAQSCGQACCLPHLSDSVLITLILCITLFGLCWLICWYIKTYKLEVLDYNKEMEDKKKENDKENDLRQKEKEKEKEEALYRSRLLNFMEKRATESEEINDGKSLKTTIRKFHGEYSEDYIKILRELVGMKPPSKNPERPGTEGGA